MASTATVTNQKAKQSQSQGEPVSLNSKHKEIINEADPSKVIGAKIEKSYGSTGSKIDRNRPPEETNRYEHFFKASDQKR